VASSVFRNIVFASRKVSDEFVFTLEAIMASDHSIIKFSDHLDENYIRKYSDDAAFTQLVWADQSINLNISIKYACEPYTHSHLKNRQFFFLSFNIIK